MVAGSENNFIERRRHPRYEVRYIVKVWLDERILCGTVINISEGGAGILLPIVLPIGRIINLEIEGMPGGEAIEKIKLKAKIVWMHNEEFLPGMYRGGLEITDIDDRDLDILRSHIKKLKEQQEKQH